jgi:putative transposase
LALKEMCVEGISTRRVKEITEELYGTSFSKSLVSEPGFFFGWRPGLRARNVEKPPAEGGGLPLPLRGRPLCEKVRVDRRVVSQGVLVISGVRNDGMWEILGVEVADTESEATYQELFRSLKARELEGVELVVSDDHEGLKAAVSRHFQGAAHQRCLLSTTVETFSAWSEQPGARSSGRISGRSSPHRIGARRWGWPLR